MKQYSLGLVCALCAAAAGAATLDSSSPVPAARPGMFAAASAPFAKRLSPEQREEWRFLKDAAASARFEHDASKLALAKSQDPQVRNLAATLLNHQTASLQSLQSLLHTRHMAPPMLANDQRKALNRMGRLQGAKFDREWMEWVAVRSQQGALLSYEKAAASARDPQLRGWIDRSLPTLRYQVATAERIVHGGTKYASLAPHIVVKAPAVPNSRTMGAAPAPAPAVANTADLSEGNMVLGPARSVAAKFSEPSIR